MNMIKIVTDSTADLPSSLVAELNITVVPCLVHFGRETFRDGVDLNRREFYARLAASDELPTTSAPGAGVFAAVYRDLLQDAEEVVSLHLASSLSAVYNSACLGAEMVDPSRITVLDTQQVSMGLGWLVIMAARAARAGMKAQQIVTLVQQAIPRARVLAALDTLKYLQRGGRVSRVVAMVGTLLRVKPILEVREGEVLLAERVRTWQRAMRSLVKMASSLAPLEELAVIHTASPARAEELAARLASLFPRQQMVITEVGTIIGTHVGPNGVGFACIRKG